jgi:hypothetical protein
MIVNQEQKDEIIRFVLESTPEENEKLARVMAGIRSQSPSFEHCQPEKDKAENTRTLASVLNIAGAAGAYKFRDTCIKPKKTSSGAPGNTPRPTGGTSPEADTKA